MKMKLKGALISTALALGVAGTAPAFAAWEPNKPVEFIIPAGPGGGADQMARMIQGIITKNNLMKQAAEANA
jgi:tripartite-type tricarboxylate transporter receptor subunit TctC